MKDHFLEMANTIFGVFVFLFFLLPMFSFLILLSPRKFIISYKRRLSNSDNDLFMNSIDDLEFSSLVPYFFIFLILAYILALACFFIVKL
ncbi:hypothetical protein [Methylovulum psychrotolerans]|uniref:Uncharacterized protein n=1 Tax=Methylovulum psychrotolerans TaxID=1704499 RepID=A0A2S5CIT4_9GAMM|nr:hypothetical protein [Methylovulum psychrotolerans]POZ50652.1 hypothetical protein AADEFJLK_03547 [Methylovulum psychrotolerans]